MSEPSPGAGETSASSSNQKPFSYLYPQASPCGALLGYKQNGDELTLITTIRATHVGPARSLTAGGFWEVASILSKPVDTIQDGNAELYREMHEELGEVIKTILPYEAFNARAEYIWDGMIRKNGIGVHAVVQKAIRLTDEEFNAIMELPETDEQRGKVPETFLTRHYKNAAEAENDIRKRLADFRNTDEREAVVRWYHQKNAQADKEMSLVA